MSEGAAPGVDARARPWTPAAYETRRRMTVRERPTTSERTLASATHGHELAVLGSVLADWDGAADADCVVADDDCNSAGEEGLAAGAAGAGGAAAAVADAVGTVARTSCSVMNRGGADVTMVALSRSPSRSSDSWTGLPSRKIFTPRLSTSPCVKLRTPSGVRTMMFALERTTTVPLFTSVT